MIAIAQQEVISFMKLIFREVKLRGTTSADFITVPLRMRLELRESQKW